jgi:hypothetical protein
MKWRIAKKILRSSQWERKHRYTSDQQREAWRMSARRRYRKYPHRRALKEIRLTPHSFIPGDWRL